MKNEIILFDEQNVKLEVNVKDETVWLSLDQMAELFKRDKFYWIYYKGCNGKKYLLKNSFNY